MASATGQPSVRLGVLDSDTGFLQVLANRLDAAGWQYRFAAAPVAAPAAEVAVLEQGPPVPADPVAAPTAT